MVRITTNTRLFWEKSNNKTLKVLYGAGIKAEVIIELAKKANFKIDYLIDSDLSKNGHCFNKIPVLSIDVFKEISKGFDVHVFVTVRDLYPARLALEANLDNALILLPIDDCEVPCFNMSLAPLRNMVLKNKDLTIISNTCVAAHTYKLLDLRYNSPTIATTFKTNDFYKFCKNFKYYMAQELEFVSKENWYGSNTLHVVARLDDVEIEFQYKTDFAEIKATWERRKSRINYDNLFFIWDVGNYPASTGMLNEFADIELGKKLIMFRDTAIHAPVKHSISNINWFAPLEMHEKKFLLCDWLNGDVEY